MMHQQRLRMAYTTDFEIDPAAIGKELHRALAGRICKDTKHYPKPCLECLRLTEGLTKPVARALLHAGAYERGAQKLTGYAAAGSALDHIIEELAR